MEASIAFGVGDELAAFIVPVATFGFIGSYCFTEVVFVDEVMTGVVGRVDVNELEAFRCLVWVSGSGVVVLVG